MYFSSLAEIRVFSYTNNSQSLTGSLYFIYPYCKRFALITMRIAFVGKGGSGKTTLTALFCYYLIAQKQKVFVFDADLNAHLAHHFGLSISQDLHLSLPKNQENIRKILKGTNRRIADLSLFRKTSPPGNGSHIIQPSDLNDPILAAYGVPNSSNSSRFYVVGSYNSEDIGTQCYHNNLSILENILSHSLDKSEIFVVDMVAGTDAFANSLYLQFDLIVFVLEPTWESAEVLRQYKALADSAGISNNLGVLGNKIIDDDDMRFIKKEVHDIRYFGNVPFVSTLRRQAPEDISKLLTEESELAKLFSSVFSSLKNSQTSHNARLQKLHGLHKAYVSQAFISERFGDLTEQIDPEFIFPS